MTTANNWQITDYGNWTNSVGNTGFLCQKGTVTFANPTASPTITILGDNTWYIFQCMLTTANILFQSGKTQTMANITGALFQIHSSTTYTTLHSTAAVPPLSNQWNFTLNPNAQIDMINV